jgi:hypothetical protein
LFRAPLGWLLGRVRGIMRTYKAKLGRSGRRATALPPATVQFAVRRGATSPLVGRTLRDVARPPNPLVVAVGHAGEIIFPRATTRLALGEVVQIMAEPAGEPAWRAFLEGTPARPGSGPKGWTRPVSRAALGRSGGS